jgi:endonuclease YncB( thermonuclease family)
MFKGLNLLLRLSLAIVVFAISASAQWTLSGEVIDIVDGKTVRLATQTGEIKVELQFIDVPEPGQDLYERVKDHLRNLAKGKVVSYRPLRIRKGLTIGRVMVGGVDLSLQMIRDGAAWHVSAKSVGQDVAEYNIYQSMESTAKSEKRGLWSIPGLKPAWEVRAEKAAEAKRVEDARYTQTNSSATTSQRKPGAWGDVNPTMRDVGALMNGYNEQSGVGYLSTSLLEVQMVDESLGIRMLMDLTYHYKQAAQGRKGVYVITIVSRSATARFSKNNNMFVSGESKTIDLGKAKRSVFNDNGTVQEDLSYQISRGALERVVSEEVVLRIGNLIIYPSNFKYLVFNMLETS